MSSPGDPTVRMPSVGSGPPPPPRPPPGAAPGRDGRWWWIAVGIVVVTAVLVAVLVMTNGDDDAESADGPTTSVGTPETSAASATSITAPPTTGEPDATTVAPSTDAPTTPAPTTAAAPTVRIVSFTGPSSVACTAPTTVELSWSTENAQSTTLTIDGTAFGNFVPSGTRPVPFACDGNAHVYALTATGTANDLATSQLSISQSAG